MAQAGFAYEGMDGPGEDALSQAFSISIFANRPSVREELREDAAAAGLAVREYGPVAALLEGEPRPLGDLVLLDCPVVDAATLAALSRLDIRAARAGAHLVISTSVAALDDVFACCDQSGPQILVDPTRTERVVALGRVLARVPSLRLRELSEDERLALLRLTEQVGEIARRLERLGTAAGIAGEHGTFRVESPTLAFARTARPQQLTPTRHA